MVWTLRAEDLVGSRSLLMSRSSRVTWAPMPTAICAAFLPETPPPMTTTLAGAHAGHAAGQHAAAAVGAHQVVRADLRGQPARDLGHRGEQRQRAVGSWTVS